jgi:hypothetical protein
MSALQMAEVEEAYNSWVAVAQPQDNTLQAQIDPNEQPQLPS